MFCFIALTVLSSQSACRAVSVCVGGYACLCETTAKDCYLFFFSPSHIPAQYHLHYSSACLLNKYLSESNCFELNECNISRDSHDKLCQDETLISLSAMYTFMSGYRLIHFFWMIVRYHQRVACIF